MLPPDMIDHVNAHEELSFKQYTREVFSHKSELESRVIDGVSSISSLTMRRFERS